MPAAVDTAVSPPAEGPPPAVAPPMVIRPAVPPRSTTQWDTAKELKLLREVVKRNPALYRSLYEEQCIDALRQTSMFGKLPEEYLKKIAEVMDRTELPKGTFLMRHGKTLDEALIIADGTVRRWALVDGRQRVAVSFCPRSCGTLHLFHDSPARLNAECTTDVVGYLLTRPVIEKLLQENPGMSRYVISSLVRHIRSQQLKYVTPLLEQKALRTTFTATSIAAAVESYYRSGMNALINQRIQGGPVGKLFPLMHVQVPMRVVYINGLKQIRAVLETVDVKAMPHPNLVRMLLSFTPGVVMCPFSSALEATNAGHCNPESMKIRWIRGFAPRLVREVIFGVGMNQMSDFFADYFTPVSPNRHVTGALGSLTSGILSGYLSHIAHNLSTKKLMAPHIGYLRLWEELYAKSLPYVPHFVPENARPIVAQVLAVTCPIGVVRRSVQIAGSFAIINGLLFLLRDKNWY